MEIAALKRLFKAETASVPFKLKYHSTANLQLERGKTVVFFLNGGRRTILLPG